LQPRSVCSVADKPKLAIVNISEQIPGPTIYRIVHSPLSAQPYDGPVAPAPGSFLWAIKPPAFAAMFMPATESPMRWRISPQPPSEFNAYLAGWAIVLSVVLILHILVKAGAL
jgi:hypothetical protein